MARRISTSRSPGRAMTTFVKQANTRQPTSDEDAAHFRWVPEPPVAALLHHHPPAVSLHGPYRVAYLHLDPSTQPYRSAASDLRPNRSAQAAVASLPPRNRQAPPPPSVRLGFPLRCPPPESTPPSASSRRSTCPRSPTPARWSATSKGSPASSKSGSPCSWPPALKSSSARSSAKRSASSWTTITTTFLKP